MLKKTSFQTKIIVSHILVIVFIILFLIGLFYQYVVEVVQDRSAQDMETIVSKTAMQYENLLYNMDKTALQIAANPSIVSCFQKVDKNPQDNYFIKEPFISGDVVKLLNSYNFKSDSAMRICLYNNYKDFVCTASAVTTTTGVESFFASPGFKRIWDYFSEKDHYNLYMPPRSDILNDSGLSRHEYFSVIREIKDYSSGSLPCGYVEIQERVAKMDAIFSDLGENGCALVLDENNDIVYQSPALLGKMEHADALLEAAGRVRSGELKDGSFSKEGYTIFLEKMDAVPYTIVFQQSQSTVMASLLNFNILLVLSAAAILITVIFTEVLIIKRLSRPLIELNRSIHNVTVDSLQMDIAENESSDELWQLKEAFNKVLRKLRDAIDKQYIFKTNELKSHLFALQSQMNPHFLYNVLAIIAMETQENEKVQNICSRLCRILSYSSSMNGGFSGLGEEIANAENYMALMKERYEVLFEYEIDADEEIKAIRIPKLIVQPICENCFIHAFKNREPVWKIRVAAYREGSRWYIEIHDNGSGFGEEYLREYEKMREEINLDNVKEKLDELSIGGLCIVNIYMRMMISYDNDFICRLYNDDEGAAVLLGGKIND